jgi:GNAT superfamily N-acetyltransferase
MLNDLDVMSSHPRHAVSVDASSISLRPPSSEDDPFLVRLFRSFRNDIDRAIGLSETERDTFTRQQFEAQRRSYRQRYPNSEHRIVTVHGDDAGRIWVNYRDDEVRLIDIMLLPSFQERGVGTELINRVKAEARRLGAPVRHMVHRDNYDAQSFYRRLGFKEIFSPTPSHLKMEWQPQPETNGG